MGIFDSRGTRAGRKKGESLRLQHSVSGLPLWSGQKLVNEAKVQANNSWWKQSGIPDKEKFETDYMNAFILAYTDTTIFFSKGSNPPKVKDNPMFQEMDVRYEEERD